MKVKKLLHTRMRVSDMEQTLTFYREVLGLEVVEQKVSPRGSQLAFWLFQTARNSLSCAASLRVEP